MSKDEAFFLPGVSFNVDGETVPARDLSWAMIAPCGCISGLHLITRDTVTEEGTWKAMSGNAQMIKQDKGRGFSMRLIKHKDFPFDNCTHSPRWGYMPPPTPIGFVWATTSSTRALHLVPLTPFDKDEVKETWREWEEDGYERVPTLCGRKKGCPWEWSQTRHRKHGKVSCSHCVKIVEKQTLPLHEGVSA